MSSDEIGQAKADAAELHAATNAAAALHGVPCTLEEIIKLMRGLGWDVDDEQVVEMLAGKGLRPRSTPFSATEIARRAAKVA